MKKLEELEISPTPWEALINKVVATDGYYVGSEEDARFIAAAPNMYKTEYDLVDVIERLLNGWAGTCDTPSQDEVVAKIEAAKNALAKAAGEEVK